MECGLEHVKLIIKTVCILHNICIDAQDNIETDWDITTPTYKKPTCNAQTLIAANMRDALCDFFVQNPLL